MLAWDPRLQKILPFGTLKTAANSKYHLRYIWKSCISDYLRRSTKCFEQSLGHKTSLYAVWRAFYSTC